MLEKARFERAGLFCLSRSSILSEELVLEWEWGVCPAEERGFPGKEG